MITVPGSFAVGLCFGAFSTSGSPEPWVALYALHPEFAPFWCPACASAYCEDHWLRYEVEEEGFHEETRGTCPCGHERMLLD